MKYLSLSTTFKNLSFISLMLAPPLLACNETHVGPTYDGVYVLKETNFPKSGFKNELPAVLIIRDRMKYVGHAFDHYLQFDFDGMPEYRFSRLLHAAHHSVLTDDERGPGPRNCFDWFHYSSSFHFVPDAKIMEKMYIGSRNNEDYEALSHAEEINPEPDPQYLDQWTSDLAANENKISLKLKFFREYSGSNDSECDWEKGIIPGKLSPMEYWAVYENLSPGWAVSEDLLNLDEINLGRLDNIYTKSFFSYLIPTYNTAVTQEGQEHIQ